MRLRYGAPGNGCYLGFNFNGNPEDSRWVTVKQNLTVGQWYHIAGTYNGTDIKSYLDGNLTDTNKISAIRGNPNRFLIGNDGWANVFIGKIDEVRIHKRALSPEEIKASYDAGIYKLYRNFTALAGGTYNYQAYAQNLAGAVNQTEIRNLNLISSPTPDVCAQVMTYACNGTQCQWFSNSCIPEGWIVTPFPAPRAGTVARNFSSSIVAAGAMITVTLTPAPSTTFDSPYDNGSYTISGTFKDQISNIGIVSGSTNIRVGAGYDANSDGMIDRNEAIQAVIDYFIGNISRQDAIDVVILYFQV